MRWAMSIEVPLPEGAEPSPSERDALEALLRAMVDLSHPDAGAWRATARRLEADGWQLRCRLGWIAEARRGRESEQAVGRSRDEAFEELLTLTELDQPAGHSA